MKVAKDRHKEIRVLVGMKMMEKIVKMEMMNRRKKKMMKMLANQKFRHYRPNIKLQKNGDEKSWQRDAEQRYRRSGRQQKKEEDHPPQKEKPQEILRLRRS